MEKLTKKQYPSQLNSKTISARIPVQDYVTFLEEAMENGISLNDWLLMKIYKSIGSTTKRKFIPMETELYGDNENNYCLRYHFPYTYGNTKFNCPDDMIEYLMEMVFDKLEKKEPNLLDAKVQIQMIANKKLHRKDCLDFMQELGELLKEIEE
jgi:hypothetical protein